MRTHELPDDERRVRVETIEEPAAPATPVGNQKVLRPGAVQAQVSVTMRIAPSRAATLRRLALLEQSALGAPRSSQVSITQFDTPQGDLSRHGLHLWIDSQGSARTLALSKRCASDAASHRSRVWTLPVGNANPADVAPELSPLIGLVGKTTRCAKVLKANGLQQRLAPVFQASVRRSEWLLQWQGTTLRAVLDQGELRCAGVGEPLCEIELVLQTGEAVRLFDFALHLHEHVPLRVCPVARFDRARAAASPEVLAAVRARRIELTDGLDVDAGFARMARNCLAQIRDNEAAVTRHGDAEAIHQMRIGLRRMRTALRLVSRWIAQPREITEELEWLTGELGTARDADVLCNTVWPTVTAAIASTRPLDALQHALREAAASKRQRAMTAIDSARYGRLVLRLGGWIEGAGWRALLDDRGQRAITRPLCRFAPAIVSRLHRKLREASEGLAQGTAEQRHRARIVAKRLRYGTEFFEPLLAARCAARYIGRLAALQEALGRLNDAAAADQALQNIARTEPRLLVEASFAQGVLAAQAHRYEAALRRAWRQFESLDPPSARADRRGRAVSR